MDLAPNHTLPKKLKNVSWNPWTDIRERDDVKALNVPFPFGPLPEDFQVQLFYIFDFVSWHIQYYNAFKIDFQYMCKFYQFGIV